MLISPRRGVRAEPPVAGSPRCSRSSGAALLAAAALLGGMALPLVPQSWAADGWQVRADGPCTVRSHGQPMAADVLRDCLTAVPRVSAFHPIRKVLMVVPADAAELRALAPEAGDLTDVAGVATRDRILINPDAWAGLSPAGRQVVLTHETTHLALRAVTTPRTPQWLVEGVADHVGLAASGLTAKQAAQELAAEVRHGRLPGNLPTDQAFATTPATAYEGAWLAVDLLARQYGEARLLALYTAVGRDGDLDAALRDLGTTRASFTAAWRADLVRRLT